MKSFEEAGSTLSSSNFIKEGMKLGNPQNNHKNMKENRNLPVKVENKYDGKNFFVKFYMKVRSLFKRKPDELEEEIIQEKQNLEKQKNEEIALSSQKIAKLKHFADRFAIPELKEIHESTSLIHKINIEKEIKIQKLMQFHMYYTDNFISLFDKMASVFDDKMKMLNGRIFKLNEKTSAIDKDQKTIDHEVQSFNDNLQRKKDYEKFVQNGIAKLLDSYTVERSNKVAKFSDISDGSIRHLGEQTAEVTTIEDANYMKVSAYNINVLLLPVFNDRELLATLTYLDGDKQKSIFKVRATNPFFGDSEKWYYVILKLHTYVIDILKNYQEEDNAGSLETLKNKINLLQIEKEKIVAQIKDLENKKVIMSLEESDEALIKKYLAKINSYYDNISMDVECDMEKQHLNDMLDIEMLEI